MKVKIGERVYDSEQVLIMLNLEDEEKSCIADMCDEHHIYASFPSECDPVTVEQLMEEFKNGR